LVKLAPGSIYQVRVGFKGSDTYLDCYHELEQDRAKLPFGEPTSIWQHNFSYPGFKWNQREDPCYPAFYSPEHFINRNLLASDIGLTAKQNDEGKLWVYATSLVTAKSLPGVEIEVFDFQQQSMAKAVTSEVGDLFFEIPRKAFFVVATEGTQKGYLRLADGLSLSLSEFNAGGTGFQEGLRGYIYGDRDVWRPGDSVFLNFILWDPDGKIDSRHPVKLTVTNSLGQKEVDMTSPVSLGGIYDLGFSTSTTDPTGRWMAKVEVGNAVFSKAIRIETIKPNRLKIDAKLPDAIIANQSGQKIELESAWLFGTPASNLKAIVEAQFSPLKFSPTGFTSFTFSDPARKTPGTVSTIFDGSLNASGKASIEVPNLKDYLPEGQLTM
jgi:uncharacterized protein YfaS (alpha-2-macroglobulin family)